MSNQVSVGDNGGRVAGVLEPEPTTDTELLPDLTKSRADLVARGRAPVEEGKFAYFLPPLTSRDKDAELDRIRAVSDVPGVVEAKLRAEHTLDEAVRSGDRYEAAIARCQVQVDAPSAREVDLGQQMSEETPPLQQREAELAEKSAQAHQAVALAGVTLSDAVPTVESLQKAIDEALPSREEILSNEGRAAPIFGGWLVQVFTALAHPAAVPVVGTMTGLCLAVTVGLATLAQLRAREAVVYLLIAAVIGTTAVGLAGSSASHCVQLMLRWAFRPTVPPGGGLPRRPRSVVLLLVAMGALVATFATAEIAVEAYGINQLSRERARMEAREHRGETPSSSAITTGTKDPGGSSSSPSGDRIPGVFYLIACLITASYLSARAFTAKIDEDDGIANGYCEGVREKARAALLLALAPVHALVAQIEPLAKDVEKRRVFVDQLKKEIDTLRESRLRAITRAIQEAWKAAVGARLEYEEAWADLLAIAARRWEDGRTAIYARPVSLWERFLLWCRRLFSRPRT